MMNGNKTDNMHSFFFIENTFYYDMKNTTLKEFEQNNDMLESIAAHNKGVQAYDPSTPFFLPKSALNNSNVVKNEDSDDSLDSDCLEPRKQVQASEKPTKHEEDKHADRVDIIDSESHDSYNSSAQNSQKMNLQDMETSISWTKRNPKNYSELEPEASFPTKNGVFKKKHMSHVKFEDLNVKIGQPYIYRHRQCDHMFIFSNIRKYKNLFDNPSLEMSPKLVSQESIKRRI